MRYVNDKYQQHYKNLEKQEKYNEEKADYSLIVMISFFVAPVCFLVLFCMAVSIADKNNQENSKNKFIEIGTNSLGCIRYRYNQDTIWKCPESQRINQIEKRVCTGAKGDNCRTEYEPVIN